MALLVSLAVFLSGVIACLILGIPLWVALALGLVCFLLAGLRLGFRAGVLIKMAWEGAKTSFVVLRFLLVIGCLTALWRASGTISFFVYYGMKMITPPMFVIYAFLIPLVLSYILGTSFGVTGTAGVMLMVLARSGGVDPLIVAGAVMSGAYFGDRCSPASSSAFLTSEVSGADHLRYQKMMLKTGILPTVAALAVYVLLSLKNPLSEIDSTVVTALKSGFDLSWYIALPAIILVILPWLKISAFCALAASGAAAFTLAVLFQKQSFLHMLAACILGYNSTSAQLGSLLNGGGVLSMLGVMAVVLLSCSYSGIFNGTDMLKPVQEKLGRTSVKIGLFPAQVLTALVTSGVFCNQSLGIILSAQMFYKVYEERGRSKDELAADIGSSIITIAGLIPWSIASTVPLAMLGVGSGALLYSTFLYAVPICYFFTKRLWFKTPRGVPDGK